jgi:hypothetical protein
VPLFVVGGVSIVAGGLTAAVTGPTGWQHGPWVAAFLVLVAGVAQVGLGVGQSHLTAKPMSVRSGAGACALWNSGCAVVIAGTLLSSPAVVSLGSAPLVAVLAMATTSVGGCARRSHVAVAYLFLLVVLLISVPIGIALAWARN